MNVFRDLSRNGKHSKIQRRKIGRIMNEISNLQITLSKLYQHIFHKTNATLHITSLNKMMQIYNRIPKCARRIYINREDSKAVYRWQRRTQNKIGFLKHKRFIILVKTNLSLFMTQHRDVNTDLSKEIYNDSIHWTASKSCSVWCTFN